MAYRSAERERIKALEREVKELRQANEILRLASAFSGAGGARPLPRAWHSLIPAQGPLRPRGC